MSGSKASIEQLRLVRFNKACEMLAVSRRTLVKLVEQGQIKIVKVGVLNQVEVSEIERFINENRSGECDEQ